MLDAYDMMAIMNIVMFLLASNETRFGYLRQNLNNDSKLKRLPLTV